MLKVLTNLLLSAAQIIFFQIRSGTCQNSSFKAQNCIRVRSVHDTLRKSSYKLATATLKPFYYLGRRLRPADFKSDTTVSQK